ncbi:MAG: gliding motility-associated C-terminal domain-containing protein [Saprospiraceae bacterium]|nr:gliding motility-associated C-terminal domain-containing protein [Saprospiraceae bacterium]
MRPLLCLLFLATWFFIHAQPAIELADCGVSYIDPQDVNDGMFPQQDTLRYREYFSENNQLRNFFVDINAFGGSQTDRTSVYAILPDSSLKLMGSLAFGACATCVNGFAFLHENQLLAENVTTQAEMNMWLQSLNQPVFGLPGNLQTLAGVGRISGKLPFCAIGWVVEYSVYSNPNTSSTEFSTHIHCPQAVTACPIEKSLEVDCQQDSIFLQAILPQGCFDGQATVRWSNSNGWVSNAATAALPLNGNLGMYYLTVEDDCCSVVDSLPAANPPFAQAPADVVRCSGENLSLAGTGGSGHFWTFENGVVFNDSILVISNLTAGDSGFYVLHAFNETGCEDTDSLLVTVNIPPDPEIPIPAPCLGDTLFLQITNAEVFAQLSWFDPQGNLLNPPVVADFQLDDTGEYTLRATDPNGCEISKPVLVSGHEPPNLSFEIEESCDSVRVYGIPADYQYVWSTGAIGPVFSTAEGNLYSVTVTDAAGCAVVRQVETPQPDGPDVSVSVSNPFCPGDFGTVEMIPADEDRPMIFSSDGGETYQLSPLFEKLAPGDYTFAVQDILGCIQTFPVSVETPDTMGVELNLERLVVRPNAPISLTAATIGNIQVWQWLPEEIDTGGPVTEFLAQGSLDVRIVVQDDRGCKASDGFRLEVVLGDIYAPSAFSPNGDGINDRFTLYSDNGSGEIIESLLLFNRWGALVFEAKEMPLNVEALGWNGLVGGKMEKQEVFTYWAVIRFGNGVRRALKGDVVLMR